LREGFTLVELLVVIAIIGVLIGLLLPAVQAARELGRQSHCVNNLKQIGLAIQTYHEARQRLPSGYRSGVDGSGNDTGPGWGWATQILPQMEQGSIFDSIDLSEEIESSGNARARTVSLMPYLCPSDVRPEIAFPVGPRDGAGRLTATTCDVSPANYVGNFGINEPGVDGEGVFFRNSEISFRQITDGLGKTLFVGERSFHDAESTWVGAVTGSQQVPAPTSKMMFKADNASNFVLAHTSESYGGPTAPTEINNFTSAHTSGINFVFGDGHVALLGSDINYETFQALSTRNKGETLSGVP